MQRAGITAGTVSGTALDVVYVRLLQLGDPGGHARRALQALDDKFGVAIGRKICDKYFIAGGKAPEARYRSAPRRLCSGMMDRAHLPLPNGSAETVPLKLDDDIIELLIATGFAEVWLAKEGHDGNIFINFLHKIELPLIYVLYGAMLAGVDGVVVGAGNPDRLPALCQQLTNHEAVVHEISVLYRETGEEFAIVFDPKQIVDGKFAAQPVENRRFWRLCHWNDSYKHWLKVIPPLPTALSLSIIRRVVTMPIRWGHPRATNWDNRFMVSAMKRIWLPFAPLASRFGWWLEVAPNFATRWQQARTVCRLARSLPCRKIGRSRNTAMPFCPR